jgi:hypothetical protein
MNSSEDGRFSQETSVIIATIVEVMLRRLTNRPTVARVAAGDMRPVLRIPTRACDPRTEMTRPKELAVVE